MDQRLYIGLVLIDLQKAFDTVDHVILIKKLRAVGARDIVLSWFTSYLAERNQIAEINSTHPSPEHVTCGVPQ